MHGAAGTKPWAPRARPSRRKTAATVEPAGERDRARGVSARLAAQAPASVATTAAAATGLASSASTRRVRIGTLRGPMPASSRAAVTVMPTALAAAMPVTPQGPTADAPIPAVTAMPDGHRAERVPGGAARREVRADQCADQGVAEQPERVHAHDVRRRGRVRGGERAALEEEFDRSAGRRRSPRPRPSSTMHAASARSRSTRSRARSMSPSASGARDHREGDRAQHQRQRHRHLGDLLRVVQVRDGARRAAWRRGTAR